MTITTLTLNDGTTTKERGALLPFSAIKIILDSKKEDIFTKGIDRIGITEYMAIDNVPKSIESGTSGAISMFAGIDTSETIPILYATNGSTEIFVATVAETTSRSDLVLIQVNHKDTTGVQYIRPNVAINDN